MAAARVLLHRRQRWSMALFAAAMFGALGVARWIAPAHRGYGTHEQLGLPACAFRIVTGVNCPSCGMTTSFAYLVRGEIFRALDANPGGFLLACSFIVLGPWCAAGAIFGRMIGFRPTDRHWLVGIVIILMISLANWGVRFLVNGRQGWSVNSP